LQAAEIWVKIRSSAAFAYWQLKEMLIFGDLQLGILRNFR